jgi:hypothetical protein
LHFVHVDLQLGQDPKDESADRIICEELQKF